MFYQIIPLEIGSIVDREIFQKDNMEIKCGMVYKLGSVITKHKPSFLKQYQPEIGICIEDIKGAFIFGQLEIKELDERHLSYK